MDSGSIWVDGMEISGMKPSALSDYRRENLGFVFQFYNLVPNLTVLENIQLCEYISQNPLDTNDLIFILGRNGCGISLYDCKCRVWDEPSF